MKVTKIFPDFLEKDPAKTVKSDGVLGHLYRDVKNDEAQDQFFKNDWENSILLQYEMDKNIMGLIKNR